jgi:hypothetical protein
VFDDLPVESFIFVYLGNELSILWHISFGVTIYCQRCVALSHDMKKMKIMRRDFILNVVLFIYCADACMSNPCPSYMQCLSKNASADYTCRCPPGLNGTKCDVIIDLCASNPCGSGGACHNVIGRYECVCNAGRYGMNCENAVPVQGTSNFFFR